MILPSKYVPAERSLIAIGSEILAALERPKTVSEVWTELREARAEKASPLAFDLFVLALTLLCAIGALREDVGLLKRGGGT